MGLKGIKLKGSGDGCNKDLYGLYPSPNIIWVTKSRRMRWVGHAECMVERRGGEPEVKRPVGILRHRWEGNIKMDLKEVGWVGMEWIAPAQYIGTGGSGCSNEHLSPIKCGKFLDYLRTC